MAGIIKNINTILAKVKMGEIVGKTGSRLFPKFEYAHRRELTEPYLHQLDHKSLLKSVDSYINENNHLEVQGIAQSRNRNLVDPKNLGDQMKKIWKDFPKEIVHDIFNMYYHDSRNIRFKDRTPGNKFQFDILERSADPTARVMTRESNIKSMFFTRGMVQYYLAMMAMLEQEDPEKFEQMMDKLKNPEKGEDDQEKEKSEERQEQDGQGEEKSDQEEEGKDGNQEGNPQGDGDQQPDSSGKNQQESSENSSEDGSDKDGSPQDGEPSAAPSSQGGNGKSPNKSTQDLMDEVTQRFDDSAAGKKLLEEVMNTAKKASESIENLMGKEEIDQLWEELSDRSTDKVAAQKLNQQWLTKMELELRSVSFSMNGLKQKIKHLLDKSVSYFSAKETPYYDNIFEAESLGGLQDYELLHPKLRKVMLEDIHIKETKKMGKIDIYVDVSGSMESSCGVQDTNGRTISKVLFSKSMVFKMKELNLLNEVYQFENEVKHVGNTTVDILTIGGGGGTNLNRVVKSVNFHKRNAIVLTDAKDRCRIYSPYAFFIGVMGAQFQSFDSDVLQKYHDGGQLLVFDGKRTYQVDAKGKIQS